MKNKNDPAFVVDAGKILAQFHLGGCRIVKDAFFFNSGIVDMEDGADPVKPGKVQFDTQNSGLYEFAYMPKTLSVDIGITYNEFQAQLDAKISADASLKDDQSKIDKLKKEELKKINEEIDKKIQDHETKTYLDSSFEVIQKYFANFAGDANAKAMQKSDVVICYLPEEYFKGPASVKKYKDFKIATIDPKKKEVLAKQRFEKWRDDGDTKLVPLIGLAYKVGYSMEVETM